MPTLLRILRWLCLLMGIAGMAMAAWAFFDPSAFPSLARDSGMMGEPPSPRWRAVFVFVFSFAIAAYGAGRLRHRELPDRDAP